MSKVSHHASLDGRRLPRAGHRCVPEPRGNHRRARLACPAASETPGGRGARSVFREESDSIFLNRPGKPIARERDEHALVPIDYTSGTTALPKGVELTDVRGGRTP